VYALAREQGVTVTLDGQGPDEMMGGYVPTMYPSVFLDNLGRLDFRGVLGNARGLHQRRNYSYREMGIQVLHELGTGKLPRTLMPSVRKARTFLRPDFCVEGMQESVVLQRLDNLRDWRREVGGTRFDQELLQATLYDSLPGILRQVDRNSMAFSIEARLPFLDYRLVEFTFSLPTRQKFEHGLSKQVYRRALDGILPDTIRDRLKKLGFATAEEDWLRGAAKGSFARKFAAIPDSAPYSRHYVEDLYRGILAGAAYDPMLWKVYNLEQLRVQDSTSSPGPAAQGADIRVCVVSPGVAHAVPRTVAIAPFVREVHFVDMSGTADRDALAACGVNYYSISKAGSSPRPSIQLRRLLAQINPDVVCVHYGLGDHFFNVIAANQCPVAVIAMGSDVLHAEGDVKLSVPVRMLSKMGLRRASLISAKSHRVAADLRRMAVPASVRVNYWGCDLGRFSPGCRSAARTRLGLAATAKIVLSPRALKPLYNVRLIVESFPSLLRRWPDALLVILGPSDPQYAPQVMAAIDRLGIGDNVRVIGEVGQGDLPDYYRASDLVVSVASTEGFPNTLLEVMACEIPVLVGDIPQVRELIIDRVNARMCPISVQGIETVMLEMLADPDTSARMAVAGRATAAEFGDIDRNGQRFAEELQALARSGEAQGTVSVLLFRLALVAYQLGRRINYSLRKL
jgi:glycosyltransferase involved in cell wall biosynthesis